MQGFKLYASQLGGKSTPRSSSSSPHDEKKISGEAIFSKTGPHNWPHEFKNQNGPAIPKFLESKKGPYTTYHVREATNDCKNNYTLEMSTKIKVAMGSPWPSKDNII